MPACVSRPFRHVLRWQGTLRPDLIESASAMVSTNAECIKTHHNDTQLVRRLRDEGRILEPLKDYHKDEVRAHGPVAAARPHPHPTTHTIVTGAGARRESRTAVAPRVATALPRSGIGHPCALRG